jgi:O-antigen ligase
MWGETWQMLKDHWFLGAGLTGYQTALVPYHQAKYLEIFLYPHNFVLNFWVELGLLGLLTFLYIIGKFFYLGFKIQDSRFKKLLANTLIAVMVVILVHGLVDVPYFKNDLAVMWWVWVGLMSSLSYIRNKNV